MRKKIIKEQTTKNSGSLQAGFGFCKVRLNKVWGIVVLVAAVAVVGIINDTNVSEAFAATDGVNTVTVSDDVDLDVTPLNETGSFYQSSNSTISARTTNTTGYTLKIAASNNTYNTLVNSNADECDNSVPTSASRTGTSSTNCLTSVAAATTEEVFKAVGSTGYNNLWGYLPSKYNGSANADFLPAPNTTGDTLDVTSEANPDVDNTYTLAIGARVDTGMKLGSYANTFVVYVTANPVPYSIIYDDNVVTNMPKDVSDEAIAGSTTTLASNVPVRAGYIFKGWCYGTVTTVGGTDTCSGTTYAAGATNYVIAEGDNHLYAMWELNTTELQNWTGCSSLSTGSTIQLKDNRDGQTYRVSKLADGKCWMDNLNLGAIDFATELNSTNTNITTTISAATFNSWKKSSGTATYTSPEFIPLSGRDSVADVAYGTLYNYCATSANTYCAEAGAATGDAQYDICPAGWRLPTGGGSGEFMSMAQQYGYTTESTSSTNFRKSVANGGAGFALAGYFNDSTPVTQGSGGYYWSSTRRNGNSMYTLTLDTSNVYPASSYTRYLGFSIRCVAQ